MVRQDYILDADGDLQITNGDFVIGPSDAQHLKDIILSFPGSFMENPLLGVGILNFQGSAKSQELQALLKKNLEADGYDGQGLKTSLDSNGKLQININELIS